jgi:hypothetical protein
MVKQNRLAGTAEVCPPTLVELVLIECAGIDMSVAPRFALAALASNGVQRSKPLAVHVDGETMIWPAVGAPEHQRS